jgi:uncharacterized membrane protein
MSPNMSRDTGRRRGFLALAWRVVTSRRRLFIGLACGLIAALLLPRGATVSTRWVLAWDIGVGLFLILALYLFLTEEHGRMARDARAQQEGEWTVFAITVGAVAVSFVAIIEEFAGAAALHGGTRALHVCLVALTLVLSWLMMQFTFTFRYAHEYYSSSGDGPEVDGGLKFPGDDKPDYMDFLSFSLVLGMTFQVSDVEVTSRKLRRLATLHGFLGFLFNTVILALTVNIAAGLLQ